MKYRAAVITVSDRSSKGQREDSSGPLLKELLEGADYLLTESLIVPDEADLIAGALKRIADSGSADAVFTTGGTGFSPRDVTPEATRRVIEREVPGIPEAMRQNSMMITKKAMLSRAVAGIRKKTLIINLPGSPKAVRENLLFILDTVKHGLEVLAGSVSDCGGS